MSLKYGLHGIVVTGLILLAACAGTRETVPEEKPVTTDTTPYDESFDPRSLNDDDIVVGPASSTTNTSTAAVVAAGDQQSNEGQTRVKEINGFRVQILATNNIETASLVEQESTDRFLALGYKTYLLYETPLYKLRIGDCENRSEAEILRDLAIDNGYSGAFIVKSKIVVEP